MLKNIDITKFKEACQAVRAEYEENGIPAYLDGIFHFYRYELTDKRDAFRLNIPVRQELSAFELFAEEVRSAALNTHDVIRATPAQIRQIISLARDTDDYTSIGQHTLTRRDAATIITVMLREIERDGEGES